MQRHVVIVLVLVMVMLGGCTGLCDRLPREKDIPEYAELGNKADALPWKMKRVTIRTSQGRPMGVAVYDNGQMSAREVLVLIHGVAADQWSWRYMRGALADYRILAVDLPGCGQSDMLDATTLGSKDSPSELAGGRVLQALRAYLADYPAEHFTLVGHSLGGAVILRMFGDDTMRSQYRDVLDRAKSLVLFAPADVTIQEMPAVMKRAASVSDLEVFLGQLLGLLPDVAGASVRDGVVFEQCALFEIAEKKRENLTDPARRHAMQWMVNSAVPGQKGKIDWPQAEFWVQHYRQVLVPSLLVWGDRDPLLDSSMGYEMQRRLPHARLRIVEHAMHSLPLEQPRLSAQLIREFLENRIGAEDVAEVAAKSPEEVWMSMHEPRVSEGWDAAAAMNK